LPPALWDRLAPSSVNDPLSRRVRGAFDPDLLLNPGILGEVVE
jgi:FAD/FMN-containing dehydrogenase